MDSIKPEIQWIDLIDESVHASDDVDIGDIEAVNQNSIIVKQGFIKIHYYYNPVGTVEWWDGQVHWLKKTEQYIKKNMKEIEYLIPTITILKTTFITVQHICRCQ